MATEGSVGLWRGTVPAAARAALLTASQCVTYDVVKNTIKGYMGIGDSFGLQVATGVLYTLTMMLKGTELAVVFVPGCCWA